MKPVLYRSLLVPLGPFPFFERKSKNEGTQHMGGVFLLSDHLPTHVSDGIGRQRHQSQLVLHGKSGLQLRPRLRVGLRRQRSHHPHLHLH